MANKKGTLKAGIQNENCDEYQPTVVFPQFQQQKLKIAENIL